MIISKSLISIPSEFEYRRGSSMDATEIVTLVSGVLIEYGLEPDPKGTDSDLANVSIAYEDGYFGVITDEDKIIATFGLFPLSDQIVEIRKMYVSKIYRGRGLGRWMVNYLLQIAKENNFEIVELETATSLVEAIALYKSFGFQEMKFENKTPRCDQSYFLKLR